MDSEVDPQKTASLKHLARACSKQFLRLSQEEEWLDAECGNTNGFWALRQSADFNLWCSKLGVEAEGHRSIDLRLKDVPEVCELLSHLLQSLHSDLDELLQQNVEAEDGESNPNSESDNDSLLYESLSSSEDSQSQKDAEASAFPRLKHDQELRKHIRDTLDRLQGQAKRIEHAGAQHRKKRVEVYKEKERAKHAYEGFKELGLFKANEQFHLASEAIKERTAESFARRRIRFEYLKEHQKKRAINIQPPAKEAVAPLPQTQSIVEEVKSPLSTNLPKIPTQSGPIVMQDQRTVFSATVFTQYNLAPESAQTARAESVQSVALPHVGFPPPPVTQHGRFQCPYCLLEFPDIEARKDRWK